MVQRIKSGMIDNSLDFTNKTITSPTISAPTITGNSTFNTNTLVISSVNNSVSIGTTSSWGELTVEGLGRYSGWTGGCLTRLGQVMRYDMNQYNVGAGASSKLLFYYAYDHANWNSQYIKCIVKHVYYLEAGEGAWILDCQNGSARQLYDNNSRTTGFTFSNNTINSNRRITSVTFNPSAAWRSYAFTFEWYNLDPQNYTTTPNNDSISFN